MRHPALHIPRFPASAILVAALLALPLVLAACNSGERSLTEVDPNAVAQVPEYARVLSIVERNCVPCHEGDGDCLNADDEGEFDPNYDSCECLRTGFGLLLKVIDEDTMPPGAWPRLTEEEKLILHRWNFAVQTEQACWPCSEGCGN